VIFNNFQTYFLLQFVKMNQCFDTESGQSKSVSMTAIEGHSITKEAFEKANDEPNNKHENIPSKQPSKQNNNSDKNVEIIDLTEDENTIGGLQNSLIRKKQISSYGGMYSCKYCKQTRSTQGHIMRHVNEVHLKIKPYSCPHCKHSSSREWDLAKHINDVHLKLKPFKCNECNKSFSSKYYKENHVNNVHFNMKQFFCNDCGKSFTQRSNLNLHLKNFHLNNRHLQKRYNCDSCKIYFIREKNLKQHVSEIHEKNLKLSVQWVKPLLPGPLVFINDLKNTPMLSDVETMHEKLCSLTLVPSEVLVY
jgi:hypothetical protein